MADPFAAPEGLRDYERGTWPAPEAFTCECGTPMYPGDPVGRYDGSLMCEDCLKYWWGFDQMQPHGYWGQD